MYMLSQLAFDRQHLDTGDEGSPGDALKVAVGGRQDFFCRGSRLWTPENEDSWQLFAFFGKHLGFRLFSPSLV